MALRFLLAPALNRVEPGEKELRRWSLDVRYRRGREDGRKRFSPAWLEAEWGRPCRDGRYKALWSDETELVRQSTVQRALLLEATEDGIPKKPRGRIPVSFGEVGAHLFRAKVSDPSRESGFDYKDVLVLVERKSGFVILRKFAAIDRGKFRTSLRMLAEKLAVVGIKIRTVCLSSRLNGEGSVVSTALGLTEDKLGELPAQISETLPLVEGRKEEDIEEEKSLSVVLEEPLVFALGQRREADGPVDMVCGGSFTSNLNFWATRLNFGFEDVYARPFLLLLEEMEVNRHGKHKLTRSSLKRVLRVNP